VPILWLTDACQSGKRDGTRYGFKGKVEFCQNSYDALKDADALLVVTEWNEFRRPDFSKMKSLMKRPVVFDGRNIYDSKEMKEKGFAYYGIGR
jgi:UDPglucose 6-dehydrogenase